MWDKLALILLIIGGINWGLVGIFQLDIIAWLFGGAGALISRVLYILVITHSGMEGTFWFSLPI